MSVFDLILLSRDVLLLRLPPTQRGVSGPCDLQRPGQRTKPEALVLFTLSLSKFKV